MIYVASSWRNRYQQRIVNLLRVRGYHVYDFRHPEPGNNGFAWTEIDPQWETWSPGTFRESLKHPIAKKGFAYDQQALQTCHLCVLVLPCGRSAYLEAGYVAGMGKPVILYMRDPCEPELMYKLLGPIALDLNELVHEVSKLYEPYRSMLKPLDIGHWCCGERFDTDAALADHKAAMRLHSDV